MQLTYGQTARILEKYYDPKTNYEIAKAVEACRKQAVEETVTLVMGVQANGEMGIEIVPASKADTAIGRLHNLCINIHRRFWIKRANCVRQWSERTTDTKDPVCRQCYERADMIVHGFLCGLAAGGLLVGLIMTLVRYLG